jgi:stearoyl-CoA desaturase (delta-9 desaturase)
MSKPFRLGEYSAAAGQPHDIVYPHTVPFTLVHVACLAAYWTGVTWTSVMVAVALYWIRMFAICAGLHRLFSHRAYSTSRTFQFILAFFAQSTTQNSALWWAANHREHHQFSDSERDVHSTRHHGFLYAHMGWIFSRRSESVDLLKVRDLAKYPELVWLHRLDPLPAAMLAVATFLIDGWPGLIVGFFWSTVAVYHATFSINTFAHMVGRKRYVTGDDSRNNLILAIITMGEGWHNNHHAYPASARQGFRWWEVDPTFYILKALSWAGIVWDLKMPPQSLLRNEHRLASGVIEKAAVDLATSFDIGSVTAGSTGSPDSVLHDPARSIAGAHVPSVQEIRTRASATLAPTKSFDDIVERAQQIILERIAARTRVVSG